MSNTWHIIDTSSCSPRFAVMQTSGFNGLIRTRGAGPKGGEYETVVAGIAPCDAVGGERRGGQSTMGVRGRREASAA